MIDYIKNLFGADVRLRKWCLDKAIFTAGQPSEQACKVADAFYDWVKARACRSSGNRTDEGVRPCLAEAACVGTIVFPVRIVWRLLPRRQRMNRIVRGRDGSMPLPESGRFACRKADLSR